MKVIGTRGEFEHSGWRHLGSGVQNDPVGSGMNGMDSGESDGLERRSGLDGADRPLDEREHIHRCRMLIVTMLSACRPPR